MFPMCQLRLSARYQLILRISVDGAQEIETRLALDLLDTQQVLVRQ